MRFFKRTDIIIVLSILLISLAIWVFYGLFYADTPVMAEIYYESRLVERVDLGKNEDRVFTIPQNEHVVFRVFRDGSICFEESDCRDRICIRSGKLKTVGQSAACLPNKIILKIVRKDRYSKDDPDIIIG
jgi:hypothetical protein